MRYFIDTEFIERGAEHPIELVSIGIVSEDGRELYLQSSQFDPKHASQWVRENVFPFLVICPYVTGPTTSAPKIAPILRQHKQGQCVDQWRGRIHACPWRTRKQMAQEVKAFIEDDTPEFWGYCSGFDYVVLSQLFEKMENWPEGWPLYIRDVQHWADQLEVRTLPEQEKDEHHALSDARWVKVLWHFLDVIETKRDWA